MKEHMRLALADIDLQLEALSAAKATLLLTFGGGMDAATGRRVELTRKQSDREALSNIFAYAPGTPGAPPPGAGPGPESGGGEMAGAPGLNGRAEVAAGQGPARPPELRAPVLVAGTKRKKGRPTDDRRGILRMQFEGKEFTAGMAREALKEEGIKLELTVVSTFLCLWKELKRVRHGLYRFKAATGKEREAGVGDETGSELERQKAALGVAAKKKEEE